MDLSDQDIVSALKEINERIDHVERHLEHMGRAIGYRYAPGSASASADVPPEVVELARHGKKIEAIKVLRQATGASLAQAKHVVDRL